MMSVIVMAMLTSCGTVVKPEQIKCNPENLTVSGDGKVNVNITGTFPEKKFAKKGVLIVTPVMKYIDVNGQEQEMLGEPVTYVGQRAKVNGTVVDYRKGGKYQQYASFQYNGQLDSRSKLYLRFDARKGDKVIEQPDVLIAEGVDDLYPNVVNPGNLKPATMKYTIEDKKDTTNIMYKIQEAKLRSSETKSEAVQKFFALVDSANKADSKLNIKSISINSAASPDGGEDINSKLANNRSKTTNDYLNKQLKKKKVDASKLNMSNAVIIEDWEGLKAAVNKCKDLSASDRAAIINTIERNTDPEERERQIKNMSAAFETLAKNILPTLRRSQIVVVLGENLTDEELIDRAKNDPANLSADHILFAAEKCNNNADRIAVLESGAKQYNDARIYNNIGAAYENDKNYAEALKWYEKASDLKQENAVIAANAARAAFLVGDRTKADKYVARAAANGANDQFVALNNGAIQACEGKQAEADKNLANSGATNLRAMTEIKDGKLDAAKKTLAAVENPDAQTDFLKAVIAAKQGQKAGALTSLKAACEADASFKTRAANSTAFAAFAEDAEFQAIVK